MTINDIQVASAIAKLHADDASILAEVVEAVVTFVRNSKDDAAMLEFRMSMIGLQKEMNERDRRECLNDE